MNSTYSNCSIDSPEQYTSCSLIILNPRYYKRFSLLLDTFHSLWTTKNIILEIFFLWNCETQRQGFQCQNSLLRQRFPAIFPNTLTKILLFYTLITVFIQKFNVCPKPSIEAFSRFLFFLQDKNSFSSPTADYYTKLSFSRLILKFLRSGLVIALIQFCLLGGLLSWRQVCFKIISSVLPVTYFDKINKSIVL